MNETYEKKQTTSYIDANGNRKTGVAQENPAYNPDMDYQAQINKAAGAGDYAAAGYYEAQRNAKIQGQGLNYGQTNLYSKYLPQVEQGRKATLEQGYRTQAEQAKETGYYNSAMAQLQKTYQEQLLAADEEAAATTRLAMEKLQAQKDDVAAQYGKVNRQLYTDTQQTMRTTPERLAAMGYTGGLAESSILKQNLSYQQALRDNEQARIDAAKDIDLQMRQSELEQEIARQQARQQAQQNYYSGYSGIMSGMQSQQNYENEQQIGYAMAAAESLAQYGNFEGYRNVTDLYGNRLYTDAQIAAMKAEYDRLAAAKAYGRSSGGGYGDYADGAPEDGEGTETQARPEMTSLDYQPDEGIFTWNGKRYGSKDKLISEMESAGLTMEEAQILDRKLTMYLGEPEE